MTTTKNNACCADKYKQTFEGHQRINVIVFDDNQKGQRFKNQRGGKSS